MCISLLLLDTGHRVTHDGVHVVESVHTQSPVVARADYSNEIYALTFGTAVGCGVCSMHCV